MRHLCGFVAGAVYVAGLAWATLNPSAGPASASVGLVRTVIKGVGGPEWMTEVAEPLANTLIFVPLPLLVASLGRVWPVRAWLLVGLLMSGSIEMVQGVVLDGRSPSLLDVVTNTTGAVMGAVLTRRIARFRARRPVP